MTTLSQKFAQIAEKLGKQNEQSLRLATGLELYFLGTSSARPTPFRNVSSLALSTKSGTWLFDCGEGTDRQISSSQLTRTRINNIFITHLHADHVRISFNSDFWTSVIGTSFRKCIRLSDLKVNVFGPEGLSNRFGKLVSKKCKFNETVGRNASDSNSDNTGPLSIMPDSKGVYHILEDEHYKIVAKPIKHSIFTLGYVIYEKDQPTFDEEKLDKYGLKNTRECGLLRKGETITFNGTVIKPEDVLKGPRKGRKIVILGDTCDASNIADLAEDCDVLVHEATCRNEHLAEAIQYSHSTAKMAAEYAKRIRAKTLILNHFSPRVFGNSEGDGEYIRAILNQAKAVYGHQNIYAAKVMPTLFYTKDFWKFDVPRI